MDGSSMIRFYLAMICIFIPFSQSSALQNEQNASVILELKIKETLSTVSQSCSDQSEICNGYISKAKFVVIRNLSDNKNYKNFISYIKYNHLPKKINIVVRAKISGDSFLIQDWYPVSRFSCLPANKESYEKINARIITHTKNEICFTFN